MPIDLIIGFKPEANEPLVELDERSITFNVAAFIHPLQATISDAVRQALAIAQLRAQQRHEELRPNTSLQQLNDDLLLVAARPEMDFASIDRVREAVAAFTVQVRNLGGSSWLPAPYPPLDLNRQRAVLRYGNTELRVLENYLLDRPSLKQALGAVLLLLDNEPAMLRPGRRSNYLAAEDPEWNLRNVMNYCGFYFRRDPDSAWSDFSDWAERYLGALKYANLATYPGAYPFYFKIQRVFLEQRGSPPNYVRNPGPAEFYSNLEKKDVVFLSPLAHLVNQQAISGNFQHLFKDLRVPDFSLRAIPAWVSIWPYRPHDGWSDTFAQMCRLVDDAYRQRPFDVFIAACGCYGLPICDYAYSTYGVSAIYLGNITHAFFGIRQQGTRDFMKGRTNPEAWVDSDLGQRYANLTKGDLGRYV